MSRMGLYQSDWSKKPPHVHAYRAKTDAERGHYHLIEGFSKPENGSNTDQHTHYYSGITSFENGHFHRYYGISGPAIPRLDGTHYHELEETTFSAYNEPIEIRYGGVVYDPRNDVRKTHRHKLKGRTREVVGNEPLGW
ncbi:YmaF family protein [Bacillus nakamurai]|uniref:YmaF family protein n=1 Tax=Bacillus nakamurai TaxID=1793963 RepID=UPI0020C3778E|nr:YmaF family protein [Bacillus nakamurai]MCP6681298.1 YmaF family protein [Bacillus nakamurai]